MLCIDSVYIVFNIGVMRRRQIAFSQWQRTVGKIKRNELERSNRLVAEDYATSRGREERLAQQLREEQQRSVVDQARVNTLKRQLDSRPEQSTITTRPTRYSMLAILTCTYLSVYICVACQMQQ